MAIENGILYLIAGGLTLILGLLVTFGYITISRNSSKVAYERQLQSLIEDENDPDFRPQVSIVDKWNNYWSEIAKESGLLRYNAPDNTAGRDVVILGIIAGVVLGVVFKNAIAGAVSGLALVYLASVVMKNLSNKKSEEINRQLPGFLFALKANIQAAETPERAILKVIDGMPSPLYEDIVIVKHRLLANSSFQEALDELSYRTSSRDLKFLCACMIQASSSGASLESQIAIIQKVLDARREVSNELSKAVKSVQPSMWIASIVIPGIFIATYMMDPNARNFWFKDLFSWIALGAVAGLWGFGIWMSMKLVNNIKNI